MSWSGLPERIEAKIIPEPNSGCWLWLGGLRDKRDGYGGVGYDGKIWRTHKLVYTLLRHEVPPTTALDHKCRNRICCNPDHLEPVTWKENIHRGEGVAAGNRLKTHCRRGHPYEGSNLYVWNNQRYCVICSNGHKQRSARKKALEADPVYQWETAVGRI